MIQRRAILVALIWSSTSFAQPAGSRPPAVSFWRDGPLLFLGTSHTNSVDNPQIRELRQHISSFDADLLLVEGGKWSIYANPDDAIAPEGELSFAANLGRALGRRVEDADPSIESQLAHTLGVHGADRTTLFFALQMVPQFTRAAEQGGRPVEEAMTFWLRSPQAAGLPKPSIPLESIERLQALCAKELPELGSWKNAADGSWWSPNAPTPRSFLQAVQATTAEYRDQHIATRIAGELKAGKRVLVVAGGAHMTAARRLVPLKLSAS